MTSTDEERDWAEKEAQALVGCGGFSLEYLASRFRAAHKRGMMEAYEDAKDCAASHVEAYYVFDFLVSKIAELKDAA